MVSPDLDELSARFSRLYTGALTDVLDLTSLRARGCAGAVIDGGCRDIDYIIGNGYPVFCRYATPQDSAPRWHVVAHGETSP